MNSLRGREPWLPAYVALGSNLQEPARQVRIALDALAALPETRLVAVSGLYRTAPMGPQDQPEFVNAVAGLLTRLTPGALLRELKDLERARGRPAESPRWGPRIIDLDIIAMGRLVVVEPGLCIPHPGSAQRDFVLRPLADIAPDLEIPGAGRVGDLLAALGSGVLEMLQAPEQ